MAITKTALVLNTVNNFNWPFTAADVAKKLRWRQQDASSVLSYLAKRGDIQLIAQEHSDRSPIGYVNKYAITVDDDADDLSSYTNEELLAELARRMK
jgi:hypothetical protein